MGSRTFCRQKQKETFERLLLEGKLGGLAVLRNVRNTQQSGVDEILIRVRLDQGIARALPFRFVTAAGYAPNLEGAHDSRILFRLKAQLSKFCSELCAGLSRPLEKFVCQMLFGIHASQDVKLSTIGCSLTEDIESIGTEKRLSRNL